MVRYERIKTMTLDELVALFSRFDFERKVSTVFNMFIDMDKCMICPNCVSDDNTGWSCLNGSHCDNVRTFDDCIKAWLLKEEL